MKKILLNKLWIFFVLMMVAFYGTANATLIAFNGPDLEIVDITVKADTLTLIDDGTNLLLADPNNLLYPQPPIGGLPTNTLEVPFSDIFGGINVRLFGSNDYLRIEGMAPPTRDYFFDGGSDVDILDISGLAGPLFVTDTLIGFQGGPSIADIVNFEIIMIGDGQDVDYSNWSGEIEGLSVPEPSTLLLFGTGLIGIGIFRRKFKG
jgi:hypothetical protein